MTACFTGPALPVLIIGGVLAAYGLLCLVCEFIDFILDLRRS